MGMSKRAYRPWTDDEYGFLMDHPELTARKIAEELGRDASTVSTKRRQLRDGYQPKRDAGSYWSESEDEFILANPLMKVEDVGVALGRTAPAIQQRRHKLHLAGKTTGRFGNASPTRPAGRPLLAKTCPKCGLLLQADWFHAGRNARSWTRNCTRCRGESSKPAQPPVRTKRADQQSREWCARMQALTLPTASRNGQLWTGADFGVLANPDLTILEKAVELNRTYLAVRVACGRNGFKSLTGLGDPERDQWMIDNPNLASDGTLLVSVAPIPEPVEAEQRELEPMWA